MGTHTEMKSDVTGWGGGGRRASRRGKLIKGTHGAPRMWEPNSELLRESSRARGPYSVLPTRSQFKFRAKQFSNA
jgi:hypothetical protein